ncbi:ABC transporter permease [Viridibacillus sp. YIM B01967]|uniref:ABC transporter permease n=1 Tax=Viridibacillus soli TaxID=2798301 RepID=A0ABS1HB64_9BACL|nr:ABC transporter permease [Viridibacillus soli]MBK3496631.1 ABC transporter permease [Viridibacillus soli]
MLKLVQNEWMKLWRKKATWIMLIMLVLFTIGTAGIMKWVSNSDFGDSTGGNVSVKKVDGGEKAPELTWQEVEKANIAEKDKMLKEDGLSKADKEEWNKQKSISEYRLKKDLPPDSEMTSESFMLSSISTLAIATMLTIVIAAGIVASEFSEGTIKMLLTRPVKRWKILTSKLLTVLLYGVAMAVVTWITSSIVGFILFDSSGVNYLKWNGDEVVEQSIWIRSLYLYLLSSINIFVTAIFAFMIGSVFRSNALAIGISMLIWFMGGTIVFFLKNYEIVKYLFFTYTDLTQFATGNVLVEGTTMPLAFAVLSVYMVIFMAISYIVFTKRDITA